MFLHVESSRKEVTSYYKIYLPFSLITFFILQLGAKSHSILGTSVTICDADAKMELRES